MIGHKDVELVTWLINRHFVITDPIILDSILSDAAEVAFQDVASMTNTVLHRINDGVDTLTPDWALDLNKAIQMPR